MSRLIRNRTIVDDRYTLLREAASLADVPDGVPVIVPLALWKERRAALIARGEAAIATVSKPDCDRSSNWSRGTSPRAERALDDQPNFRCEDESSAAAPRLTRQDRESPGAARFPCA